MPPIRSTPAQLRSLLPPALACAAVAAAWLVLSMHRSAAYQVGLLGLVIKDRVCLNKPVIEYHESAMPHGTPVTVQACAAAAAAPGASLGTSGHSGSTVHVLFTSNGTPYLNRQVRCTNIWLQPGLRPT